MNPNSTLSPAVEHPLQDSLSPSPIKPLHTGSTTALHSPGLQVSDSYGKDCRLYLYVYFLFRLGLVYVHLLTIIASIDQCLLFP